MPFWNSTFPPDLEKCHHVKEPCWTNNETYFKTSIMHAHNTLCTALINPEVALSRSRFFSSFKFPKLGFSGVSRHRAVRVITSNWVESKTSFSFKFEMDTWEMIGLAPHYQLRLVRPLHLKVLTLFWSVHWCIWIPFKSATDTHFTSLQTWVMELVHALLVQFLNPKSSE